jgi:opacity protein-like surface antigen
MAGLCAALILSAPLPLGARTLRDELVQAVRGIPNVTIELGAVQAATQLASALAQSIGSALPVVSASAAFSYTFDPETGGFVREGALSGQLFLERADPIGRGRFNLAMNYEHVSIDTLNGQELDDLSDTRPPIRGSFTIPHFDLGIDTDVVSASATYGLTDKLEVNLVLGIVHTDFHADEEVHELDNETFRKPFPDSNFFTSARASKTGVGDLFLRAKYQIAQIDPVDVAAGLVLRLPSGNVDNFQGTGDTEVAPMLYASTRILGSGWLRVRPYLNAGVNFDAVDDTRSDWRWGTGLDIALTDRATIGLAVLGRHDFSRIGYPGAFDASRVGSRFGTQATAPRFGVVARRADFYDVSIGGRVDLWHGTIIAFANVILPLNRDGFRSDVIPLVGLEVAL